MLFLQILVEALQGIQFIDVVLLAVACPEVYHCHIVIIENSGGDRVAIKGIGNEVEIFAVFLCFIQHRFLIRQGNFNTFAQFRQIAFQFAEGCLCFCGEVVDAVGIIGQEEELEITLYADFFHTLEKVHFLFYFICFQIFCSHNEHFHNRGHQFFHSNGGFGIIQRLHIFIRRIVILNFCIDIAVHLDIGRGDEVCIFHFYPCIGDSVGKTAFRQVKFCLNFLLGVIGSFGFAAGGGAKEQKGCQKQS